MKCALVRKNGQCLNLVWALILLSGFAWNTGAATNRPYGRILETNGVVRWKPVDAGWQSATNRHLIRFRDFLRTEELSEAIVGPTGANPYRLRELTVLEIIEAAGGESNIKIYTGGIYFADQRRSHEGRFQTAAASVNPIGTEFLLEVLDGMTRVVMFDGKAIITNQMGSLTIASGEAAIIQEGQAPVQAKIEALNLVQWWLYYPAVLDPSDVNLRPEEQEALQKAIATYRRGNLAGALRQFPENPDLIDNGSPDLRAFRAALLLGVGAVDKASSLLGTIDQTTPASRSVQGLMDAVTRQSRTNAIPPTTTSEWLADSYQRQADLDLEGALSSARQAVAQSSFGPGWARVAELEFSFGRNRAAQEAVERALTLSPDHAQAHALQGFLLAGRYRTAEALGAFETAIRLDPFLANGWLGRGLVRIRKNQQEAGLKDLEMAALLEPHRALLHAYLGKAFEQAGLHHAAREELDYAQRLDPADPTGLFYSALLKHQDNRVNEAIDDLEHSRQLNDNRAVYRSRLLLDQDAAVRSVNLAHLYRDAGMEDVSRREASRAISRDYGNFSSHLFLANSYNTLLDPGRVNLRFETAATSEYLLANLLAPVGAGTLSPTLSQQEYSRLFDRDGAGLVSSTEYWSRGAWQQEAAVYGNYEKTSLSFDQLYRTDNGQRRNNDLELTAYAVRLKHQITASDSVYGQVLWSDAEGGDLRSIYNADGMTNLDANVGIRVEETQEPIALLGYQHQWSPGNHSLILGSYLNDTLEVHQPDQAVLLLQNDTNGLPGFVSTRFTDQNYQNEQTIVSLEAQQIVTLSSHTLIIGGRYQFGDHDLMNQHTIPTPPIPFVGYTNLSSSFQPDFERASVYGYHRWQIADPLMVEAGLTYDWLKYPSNFRYAPVSDDEDQESQLSPKAGLAWEPDDRTTFLAAYSRSLTGASIDQSFRLEPSQVAGINQAYRSVLPDSVSGANAAEEVDVFGILIDHRFPTRTYAGLSLNLLNSEVKRDVGVYGLDLAASSDAGPTTTRQSLEYMEKSFNVTLNQLIGDYWAAGMHYRLTYSDLDSEFGGIGTNAMISGSFQPEQDLEAWLHHVRLSGLFNHPSGFFARGEALWYQQSNHGYERPDIKGEDFWQFNVFAGWRFPKRKAEWTVGILNLFDQNYRLNPLNLYPDLARDRTFYTRLRIHF